MLLKYREENREGELGWRASPALLLCMDFTQSRSPKKDHLGFVGPDCLRRRPVLRDGLVENQVRSGRKQP